MREIAVEDAGYGEHPNHVQENGCPDGEPAPADPDHGEAAEVEDNEGNATDEVDAVGLGTDGLGRLDGVVGVDPLNEGAE